MCSDRSDVEHAAKEECKKMTNPTRGCWLRLMKAGVLKGVEKVTWVMRSWKHDEVNVDVHVDSDWAKEPERKSTSGGTMIRGTVVKHWSRTQATRALSKAEGRVSRRSHSCCGEPWNAVDDGRLGNERAGAGLDGLQWYQNDCVEAGSVELKYLWL